MTEERLPLTELLEKVGKGDFLRAVAKAVLQLPTWRARSGRARCLNALLSATNVALVLWGRECHRE